jgi:co-chaperonin GroES (HSP10)
MIKPLGGIVLVKKVEKGEKVTKGGIVISSTFSDSGPAEGIVIQLGTGEQNYKGDIISIPEIKVGDTVYYPDHSGTDIEDSDGTKYMLVNSKNILAIKYADPIDESKDQI